MDETAQTEKGTRDRPLRTPEVNGRGRDNYENG